MALAERNDSIQAFVLDGPHKSSSGGESHPSALTEPDVRLSPHPAPTIQPPASRRAATGRTAWSPVARRGPASAGTRALDVVVRLRLRHRLLPLLVDRHPRPDCRAPSLRPHYQASPLPRARPPLRLASVLDSSWVHHLEVSLGIEATGSHVPHKSLSLVSRRLHAGRRSASRQASAELCRRPTTGAWFWRRPYAFDTSATVHSRSSDQRTPDGIAPAFCRNAHHLGHWTEAACGGLDPDPAIRARGADPHLLCSKAARS
jgi:hypothetical protein